MTYLMRVEGMGVDHINCIAAHICRYTIGRLRVCFEFLTIRTPFCHRRLVRAAYDSCAMHVTTRIARLLLTTAEACSWSLCD